MKALWIYNDLTAKAKNMAEMEEINKMMLGEHAPTKEFEDAVSLLHNSQLYQRAFNEGLAKQRVKNAKLLSDHK